MIGGERDNNRIVSALSGIRRAGRNCGSGIAPHRFEQDVGLGSDFRQLLGNQKTILRVSYNDWAIEQRRIQDSVYGVLKGRMRTKQRQKLFGTPLPRRRPQPGAGPATHDQRNDL